LVSNQSSFSSQGDCYDLFLSYRWSTFDKRLVNGVYDLLSWSYNADSDASRLVRCFLDTSRLTEGKAFQQQFSAALRQSVVLVPIVSKAALERMVHHNPREVDNVLVEWILALSLLAVKRGNPTSSIRLQSIYPIFIGNTVPLDQKTSSDECFLIEDLFKSTILVNHQQLPLLPSLPEVVPAATIAKVKEVLAGLGEDLANPLLSDLGDWTVKRVVDSMCGYLGFQAWSAPSSRELPHLCADKVAVVVRDCLAQSEPPVSAQGERELQQLNSTSKESPPQVMESVISSSASLGKQSVNISTQSPISQRLQNSQFSFSTPIQEWLQSIRLSRYANYMTQKIGFQTLDDLYCFKSYSLEELIDR
jgi:hypothetical protein